MFILFFRGVALSWSLSSITMVSLLFSYVKAFKLHKKTWPGKHGLSASHKQEVESVFIIWGNLLSSIWLFCSWLWSEMVGMRVVIIQLSYTASVGIPIFWLADWLISWLADCLWLWGLYAEHETPKIDCKWLKRQSKWNRYEYEITGISKYR